MTEKTRGIVLHQIRYTDSGIVAWLYTRKFGRQSFLVRGMRKRKSGRHNIMFQPMFILDLEVRFKETREIQIASDISVHYSPAGIYSSIKKGPVAIFLGEVLASVLREEGPNERLFDFLENSIIYFDGCRDDYANFHLAFLAGLSSFLGFEPHQKGDPEDRYFDLLNGCFVVLPPLHGNFANEEISAILASLFSSSYDKIRDIRITGSLRNEVLETLVKYYSMHLPGLKKINSLEVLKSVFS
jgi:DNA repair protein RecO (recombination protein O)